MARKILVIEDDPHSLELTSYTLEQEGYKVVKAMDGLEGLRKVREEELHLPFYASFMHLLYLFYPQIRRLML